MQSTASPIQTQSDIIKTMQPQSAQNMILASNKKKKYTQQAPLSKQPQQSNQQFTINKSFNVVSILKTSTPSPQQQQHQQQPVTQSYANVVNRSIPQVMCSGNVVTVNNCQISSDINSTTIFNINHRGVNSNNNAIEANTHLATGFVGSTDASGGGSGGNNNSIGGGGSIISLTNNSTHGGNTIGISLGATGGTYSHEKGIIGVNVGCIDNRKYDFKNMLLTNNNFQTAQEYVPSSGTNSTGNLRTNQQAGGMFRGPPASAAPRNGARHMPMPTMYQQTMHQGVQGVVVPTYQQYPPRQPFQTAPQYSFSQPMPPSYFPYPYTYTVPQPQAHQRGTVGVNTSVGVGNTISVQAGPNGPMAGPPGATQAQISIAAGTVLASTVASGTNAVLGVATTAAAQQVGVPPMVGVVQTSGPTSAAQKKARRKYAIDIINPNTKKNIFEDEDLELSKNTSTSENEFSDQIMATTAAIHPEIVAHQQDTSNMSSIASGGVIGIATETQPIMPYNIEILQIPQQRDIAGQTPIVSAISDAPSVEILPSPKPRAKKILSIVPPKETLNTGSSTPQTTDTSKLHQQKTNNIEEVVINSDCVQQQQLSPEQYKNIQVPQQNTQQQVTETVNNECIRVLDGNSTIVDDSNISKEFVTEPTADTESATANAITSTNATASLTTDVRNEVSSNKNSISEQEAEIVTSNLVQQQPQELEASFSPSTSSTTTSTSVSLESKYEIISGSAALTDKSRSLHTMQLTEKDTTKPAANNEQSSASTTIVSPSNGVTNKSPEEITVIDEARNNNNVPNNDISTANNNVLNKFDKNENISLKEVISIISACDETDRAISMPQTDLIEPVINFDKDLSNNETADDNCETMSIKTSTSDNSTADASISARQSNSPTATGQQSLINYNEGQWSPNNPTGKKQYDREQLMQLREAKASRIQPEVNNVSILPQPNLMPSFVRDKNKRVQSMVGSIGGNRGADNGSGGNYVSKQASMSGVNGRGSMKGMIHVNLSLNQDVKLNETDNAWRPRALVRKDEEGDPNINSKREKDELIRRVRGILNKLTPEKFDTLVEEIIKLKIDTPDKMEDVMVLVFEKAIDEPNFSVSYARLCHRLITEVKARDERMESGTKTNLAHFRNALLDKTEREFTQNVTQSSAKEKKLQPIIEKIAKCKDPIEKAEMEAHLEEEERKIRRRSGGTVRFIGELFKISMLTGKIIHSCIDTLLNPNSEDMLECMCKLLTTVGAKFEQTPINGKESARCYSLDKIMARMQTIASKTDKEGTKVSSRVRFMLQDVIDLRKNKWQSTRNEAPKTMEQIEKETKTEQMSSQFLNYSGSAAAVGGSGANGSSMVSSKRDDRGGGGRYNDSRSSGGYGGSHSQRGDTGSLRRQQQGNNSGNSNISGGHSNGNNDDHTWTVQTGKSSRSLAVDSNKLEGLLTQNYDIGNKKMGGLSQFIWNNPVRQSLPPTTTPNSFAALSSLTDSIKNSERDRDRDRDRSGPRNKGSYNKGSMERDRYGDRSIHSRTGSSQASRENSSSRGSQGPRGMMNTSSMQKSASHSKYSQQISTGRVITKTTVGSGSGSIYGHQRGDQTSSANYTSQHQQSETSANVNINVAPAAVFEEPTESDLGIIKPVVAEIIEIASNSKTINSSVVPCIDRVKDNQRCGLLYYILADFLHLRQVGQLQRRYLANAVAYFIKHNHLSVDHFRLAYANFCAIASDLIVDIPGLWLYVFEFTGPLLTKKVITINDLWNKQLKEDSLQNLGPKFLKTYLVYCTREIGPSFTRSMWKNFEMKWVDFVPENELENFIQSNKLEYIEDELIQPEIEIKESKEKHIVKVVEHIDHLLKEGSTADCIIDYINGNIVDIDKQFIRSLTTKLCNFAIAYNDNSYKLDIDCFQKICIPVLQRYIDSEEERELECLYSMQLLVHSLEHPRGLLSELFGELYDADVIPQDSFIKWRDSKDQSAGKGVAVKGLNPFFNHVLSSETSDENN